MKKIRMMAIILSLITCLTMIFAQNVFATGSDDIYSDGDVFYESESSVNIFKDEFGIGPGDVNGDGYVNILDLIRLKKYLINSKDNYIDIVCSDLVIDDNDVHQINAMDLSQLIKILLGII